MTHISLYSEGNIRTILDMTKNLVTTEVDLNSAKLLTHAELEEIMKRADQAHLKPKNMHMSHHLENLNKIIVCDLVEHIKHKLKNNLNKTMNPYQSNGQQPFPFQQIDPRMDHASNNPELLLAQRLNERKALDGMMGPPSQGMSSYPPSQGMSPYPQMQMPQMQMPQMQMPQMQMPQMPSGSKCLIESIHPAAVKQFLNLSDKEKHWLSIQNPGYFQQLIAEVHRMNRVMMGERVEDPVLPQRPTNTGESEQESGSESGSESDSSLPRRPAEKHRNKRDNRTHDNRTHNNNTFGNNRDYNRDNITEYLSLDFRNDLREIDMNKYLLTFTDHHNVQSIELKSCLINQTSALENEPYIYVCIDEIDGDYSVASGKNRINVFGKLIQDKVVNGFIIYRPENCCKVFDGRKLLNHLTISFVQYGQQRLSLSRVDVRKISKSQSKNMLKISTNGSHYLSRNDKLNVSLHNPAQVTVMALDILDIPDNETIIVESPLSESILKGSSPALERIGIKCTMTFEIKRS